MRTNEGQLFFELAWFAVESKDFVVFTVLGSVFSVRILVGLVFFLLRVSLASVSVAFTLI